MPPKPIRRTLVVVTLEYAELSCEARFLAGKVARLTGSDAIVFWLRLNSSTLTRQMLEDVRQEVSRLHQIEPAALELTDAERAEMRREIPKTIRLCPAAVS